MQFEAGAVAASKGARRTGSLDLGKQACTLQQDVVSAEQLADPATFNNGEIHRYEVGVFQGATEIYSMTKYFKVQP